jgi:hypothetical protein
MDDTSQLQAVTAGGAATGTLPPPPPPHPASFAPTPPNQIDQSAMPLLPYVAPAAPRPEPAAANPFASAMQHPFAPAEPPRRPPSKGKVRRGVTWLILLAVVGGLVYGAIAYGSDLMELATGEDSIDEPELPLAFPIATGVAPTIRSATFQVERSDTLAGTQRFEVTTDFETGISRVVIERPDAPSLEVLTLWDQAFVRRIDQPVWYQVDRGEFPLDTGLGPERWIRPLDQLLPTALRSTAVIERATRSTVADVPTTRLLVTLDPAQVGAAIAAPTTPAPDGTTPTPTATATATLAPGLFLQPGVDGAPTFEVEIWVDDTGIVRKSILPVELGGETITVTSLSPEPWEPLFPTPDAILPLTASAMFQLGL